MSVRVSMTTMAHQVHPNTPPSTPPQVGLGRTVAPDPEQIVDYARYIGIDPLRTDLMWIAEQGLAAPLPSGWSVCRVPEGEQTDGGPEVYYSNGATGETSWDHPLDARFREIAAAYMSSPSAADTRIIIARQRASEALVGEVRNLHKPRQGATTQTGRSKLESSIQASSQKRTMETQATVNQISRGEDPMPADADTMTCPVTIGRETMTTPSLEFLAFGGGSPRGSRRITKSCSPIASPQGPGDLEVGSDAPPPLRPTATSAERPTTATPQQPRQPVVTMITPAAEALMREMVASFQHQLLEHRREIYDAIRREHGEQASARQTLLEAQDEERELDTGRLPPALPPELASTASWSLKEWCLCYMSLMIAHMAGCIVVCLALPWVLAADIWEPLVEDPRPVF